MIDTVFNLECADPDDILTLCFLSGHPKVNLIGVVVTPGADDQVALVKHVLKLLGRDIPVGVRKLHHPKECVSAFHYRWLGKNIDKAEADGMGYEVLDDLYMKHTELKIVSGAPLGNIHDWLTKTKLSVCLKELVVQGGFAGDNIVPKEYRLEKFEGKLTCPTFNLGGDKNAALYITENAFQTIHSQYYVSKNVCHGVVYDYTMHEKLKPYKNNRIGLSMLYGGMDKYLEHKSNGKLFHDPLAACSLIDKNVCEFVAAKLYYQKGEWGSRPTDAVDADSWISIRANMEVFESVLFQ